MKSLLPSATISSFSPPPLSLLNHYSIKPHLKTNLNFNPKNLTLQTHSTASQPPLFYFNLYLQLYVNAGSMQQARNLFDQMPHSQRTIISWTILMSGYTKHGPVYETLLMFIFMLSHGSVWPDAFVYSIVLRACSRVKDLSFGCGVHGLVLKRGGVVDGFVYNALVNMYASCGRLDDAIAVFQGLEKPDLVAWSSMLSGYVKNGLEEEGLRIFLEMICCGVELDSFVFSMVIKGCANLEELEFGKQIHCCMIKMGFGTYLFLENSLMDFYARCGDSKGMRRVFDGMFEGNLVSWNTLIMGYVHNSLYLEGLKVFRILMEEVSECDDFTITSSLKAITSVDKLDLGREVHGHIIRVGLESNQYVFGSLLDMYIECVNHEILNPRADLPMRLYNYFNGEKFNGHFIASMLKWCSLLSNLETGKMFHSLIIKLDLNSDPYVISSLIDMYFKCGISEAALRVFMRVKDPGTATWSALISGFCLNEWYAEALELFQKMQFDYIEANEFTFTSVLLACLVLQDLRKGRELHCKILRAGYGSNVSVVNMLMHLYSELWHYKQALKLCSLISGVDISWNLLLKACIKAKDNEMVHQILRRIQMCYGFVDPYSACYILNSCANPVLLNVGRQAQAYMTKRGVISHPTTRNCLINMYSGCGIIDDADLAFKSMPEKNPLSYRSIISARVSHGQPSEALYLFKDMQRKNNSMDPSTFKSALKAYAQMGMVDEAYRLFTLMEEVYVIEPSQEHYSCMVEAFSRAGMFEEVQNFINGIIPVKLGALIWRTLLWSCRVHGNMKVAKYALEKLVELDPSDCSTQILLKQVFLMLGKWDDASKMKVENRTMRTNSSWIEIRNKIYEFVSDQKPSKEVSDKLAEIEEKMKESGYVVNRIQLMPTIEEEEYDGGGLHHSEMKAVALGLITLPHGLPIRVMKSVRMCGHCHYACKLISTFIDREIVVKDPSNFHHFIGGNCSCRDIW
ncbi:pentatricopeptide repeat-containing protein At4g21065-like [Pistacia vera]|uniref:pentatricopeptide repeat-containing protein At4g21065-like n=1 Tax=Pistacia vera TaxID=55513 RepID=UPI001263966A|nr:pentatricopeptide repeat-containing protein At4g21065-like [Pistacia vera]